MAWPNTVVPGQTATAAQYNALVAALKTWGGDVDAGNYSLRNVASVDTQVFTADGAAAQGTPLLVTSANSGGTSLAIENTATGGHRFAWTASPGASAWLTLADVTAGQGLIAFATAGANARSPIKLPALGVIGFAAGNNLPSDMIDVGIQRNAAGVLQVSDSNGADRDLQVRGLVASANGVVAGEFRALTVAAQSSAGSNLQLLVSSPNAAVGAQVYVRANGPIYFDNQPVSLALGIKCDSIAAYAAPRIDFATPVRFGLQASGNPDDGVIGAGTYGPGLNLVGINDGGVRKLALFGSITQLLMGGANSFAGDSTFAGTVTAGGRVTANFDIVLNKSGTGANYFQIINDGRFGVDPAFYPASGTTRTQGNIYASGNVSGLAWVPHGSGASLDEVREHMRAAKTEQRIAYEGDEPPEPAIPVGAVNFLAAGDGLHVFGKKSDSEIWETVIPWMSEREPR
jgi:hypothetical protein